MVKKVLNSEIYGSGSFSAVTNLFSGLFVVVFLCSLAFGIGGCNKSNSTGGYDTYSQTSGNVIEQGQTIVSIADDISAVNVTGGSFTLSYSDISSSGSTSSADNSSFYGLNAVMLASNVNSLVAINSSRNKISSTGTGANGIFAYGKGLINSNGDNLKQTGDGSHSIMCSGGASISVVNDTASTAGASASTVATDKGGGTISVAGGIYTASGKNSAAIYSTGFISASDATLTANGAEALVVEGSNQITLSNCIVKCNYDKWGSLMYQSQLGDATGFIGDLTMDGGSFTYTGSKGGMFYNTNSTANYSLKGVTLTNSCDTLIRCIKGSWGSSTASGGGITNFVADGETMTGLIHVDSYSKAALTFKNFSVLTGAINHSNTANNVTLALDFGSSWILTADSYINGTLTDPRISGSSVLNITGNGFNIYYKSSQNPLLGGITYDLVNGGQLIPD